MSFREELQPPAIAVVPEPDVPPRSLAGAPGGARQHVRSGTSQGAVARPGGASQNSGGAMVGNAEAQGSD